MICRHWAARRCRCRPRASARAWPSVPQRVCLVRTGEAPGPSTWRTVRCPGRPCRRARPRTPGPLQLSRPASCRSRRRTRPCPAAPLRARRPRSPRVGSRLLRACLPRPCRNGDTRGRPASAGAGCPTARPNRHRRHRRHRARPSARTSPAGTRRSRPRRTRLLPELLLRQRIAYSFIPLSLYPFVPCPVSGAAPSSPLPGRNSPARRPWPRAREPAKN